MNSTHDAPRLSHVSFFPAFPMHPNSASLSSCVRLLVLELRQLSLLAPAYLRSDTDILSDSAQFRANGLTYFEKRTVSSTNSSSSTSSLVACAHARPHRRVTCPDSCTTIEDHVTPKRLLGLPAFIAPISRLYVARCAATHAGSSAVSVVFDRFGLRPSRSSRSSYGCVLC